MSLDLKSPERPLTSDQQWQLAIAQFQAADRASNVMRALVFAAAASLLGIVFSMLRADARNPLFWSHGISIALCLVALYCVIKGFRIQGEQSVERFKLLKAGNYEAYAQYEGVIGNMRGRQSARWDRFGLWAVAGAFLVMALAKFVFADPPLHV